MSSELLNHLAEKYNSDKGKVFKGNRSPNHYMELYYEYFERQNLNRNNVLSVLEIGTNTGASLRVWAEYFTSAKINGIDITRQYEIASNLDHPRIYTHIIDQGDRNKLFNYAISEEFLVNPDGFDIIIDDGSHEQTDQLISLGVLFKFLKHNGLYIIEDLITGRSWMDGNVWNKNKIKPTREVLQEFQNTKKINSSVLQNHEIWSLEDDCSFCEYRESESIIYEEWHPEICFIGKK